MLGRKVVKLLRTRKKLKRSYIGLGVGKCCFYLKISDQIERELESEP